MFDLAALARLDAGLARLNRAPAPRRDDISAERKRQPTRHERATVSAPGRAPTSDAEPRCPFLHGTALNGAAA